MNEKGHAEALNKIAALMLDPPVDGSGGVLNALVDEVQAYEDVHFSMNERSPIERLANAAESIARNIALLAHPPVHVKCDVNDFSKQRESD